MKKSIVIEIISFLLILLFMYAAVSKLLDVEQFRVQLGQSPLITSFAPVVAWGIPIIEILICLLLALPSQRLIGLYASFSLMFLFTGYIVVITQFSEYIPCSCGGVLQQLGWSEHLIFNISFIAISAIGVLLHTEKTFINEHKILRVSGEAENLK